MLVAADSAGMHDTLCITMHNHSNLTNKYHRFSTPGVEGSGVLIIYVTTLAFILRELRHVRKVEFRTRVESFPNNFFKGWDF